MDEAFTAGVNPGGLTDKKEIRILILHILNEVEKPMSLDEMTEAVLSEGCANYFELAEALSELCESECLVEKKNDEGIGVYCVTEKGASAGKVLERDLPLSVREKATASAKEVLRRRKNEKENQVKISKTEDGYKISLRVTDIGSDLMELTLFMPTMEQASSVRQRFLADPAGTYMQVLEAVTGDSISS